MSFTANDVKTLREKTGAGMMDCKKALVETNGDLDKAVDYLREKGIAKAAKKATRIAAEGIVDSYIHMGGRVGVLLEVNCESDFVSKGDKFHNIVNTVAKVIAENKPADIDALKACPLNGATVNDFITNETAVIGEKISLRRFEIYETSGKIETYLHMGGKVGVMVEAVDFVAGSEETLHDVALQIAAAKPSYVQDSDVPAEVIEKEKEIMLVQMKNDEKNANKPQNILEKIVMGKIGKFYSENCLLKQAFVKDDTQTVGQVIGSKFKVARFIRWEMGEGIEKRKEDLNEEVAKQVAAMKNN